MISWFVGRCSTAGQHWLSHLFLGIYLYHRRYYRCPPFFVPPLDPSAILATVSWGRDVLGASAHPYTQGCTPDTQGNTQSPHRNLRSFDARDARLFGPRSLETGLSGLATGGQTEENPDAATTKGGGAGNNYTQGSQTCRGWREPLGKPQTRLLLTRAVKATAPSSVQPTSSRPLTIAPGPTSTAF